MVLQMEILERPLTEYDLRFINISAEKTTFLEGNFDFAAREVFRWYDERVEYITAKGSPESDTVYDGEIEEYKEAKSDYWVNISGRDHRVNWHDDPLFEQIWTVASEAADVAIVAGSELKLQGYPPEWVASLWRGDFDEVPLTGNRAKFRDDLKIIRADLSSMGVDLAEAIIEKNALNEQHYPHFYSWLLIQKLGSGEDFDTFARRFRKGVGPIGKSQMKDLMSNPRLGESRLSKAHESPYGTNGSSPKAIYVRPDGLVELGPSDRDHTYDGLYAVGAIKWLYDDNEYRFHHDARMADYRHYFLQPEWRDTLSKLIDTDIRELVVPSGSNFRFEGLRALAKYVGLEFENLGEVDDELRWKQYENWAKKHNKPIDIFDFQARVVEGKEARLDLRHDNVDSGHKHSGMVVAMDEIILFWDEQKKEFEAIERPDDENEALRQIDRLISGEQVFVSNATVVSALQQNGMGEGLAVQIIPMRLKFKDKEEKMKVGEECIAAYRKAVRKEGRWKLTPGGTSLLSDILQPYQYVTIPEDLDDLVMSDEVGGDTKAFAWHLVKVGKEKSFLSLPEKVQNEIGISVGGLSLSGLRLALDRFLKKMSEHDTHGEQDHDRLERLEEIAEMMKIQDD
jgi:hypothetical protein